MTVSAMYGLGNHEADLSHSDIVKTNLWSWIAQIVAIFCLVVGRIAVIAFLLAISDRTYRIGRRLIYFVGCLQGVINVAEIILILRQCDPLPKLWDFSIPGTCGLVEICSKVGYLQGSIGVAADLILACYPVYIFMHLHRETRVKIGLCLIMGGGVIAAIAGICKTIAISTIKETSDITFAIYKLNTWVLTEMWFIIIFGSIPMLRSFFSRFGPKNQTVEGYGFNHTSRSTTLKQLSRSNEDWVPLDDRSNTQAAYSPSAKTREMMRKSESGEELVPGKLPGGQIMKTLTVDVD